LKLAHAEFDAFEIETPHGVTIERGLPARARDRSVASINPMNREILH
jgi:hypothetical protein